MPLFEEKSAPIDLSNRADVPKGFAVTPGAEDLEPYGPPRPSWNWVAAFRRNNELSALASSEAAWTDNEPETGFNPWEAIKGTPLEAQWEKFVDVRNSKKLDAVKRDIDRETEDRKALDSQPWWMGLMTEGAASVLSPTTLLPGGAFVRGAKGGVAIGRSALSVGAGAAAGTTAQEAALHGIEQTRTLTESGMAIGASALLGGILGAGGSALFSKGEWSRAVDTLNREIGGEARTVHPPSEPGDIPISSELRSVGAAANVPSATLDDLSVAGMAAGKIADVSTWNPGMRLLHSPAVEARLAFVQTFENSTYLKMNMEARALGASAETLAQSWDGKLVSAIKADQEIFSEYVKGGGTLARTEFQEEAGKAARRDDVSMMGDPFVTRLAQEYRKSVFDPGKVEAIRAGLLPADVKVTTASSYLSRLWNRNALVRGEAEFKARATRYIEKEAPRWAQEFDRSTDRRITPLQSEIDDLEMQKARRAEESTQREKGGEISDEDFTEGDIRRALRIVQGGAARPKGVKTLTQFIHAAGGLVDFGGELSSMGISNKSRPGFIRTERKRAGVDGGGWTFDDMAQHAWEVGYFPHFTERPSIREFLDALDDDFSKRRAVVPRGQEDNFRLYNLVNALEDDLSRIGALETKGPRFSTSEEVKGIVSRVAKAMDADADQRIGALKARLSDLKNETRLEREARFEDIPGTVKSTVDQVFDRLVGKTGEVRPEGLPIKARGPLQERTFNVPDELFEDFLENNIEMVARNYTRIMSVDVELARLHGSPDMAEALAKVGERYKELRAATDDPKERAKLDKQETADLRDLRGLRDGLRRTIQQSPTEYNYARVLNGAMHVNYLRTMGEVGIASLAETVRPAMVHGLMPYLGTIGQLATNLNGIRLSIKEGQLAGNINERVLQHRLGTLTEITDPISPRSPVEALLHNLTNVASRWNGIRLLTDMQKSIAAVMTQNRVLRGVADYGNLGAKEKAYLAFLQIDESMAGRIAKQFAAKGETQQQVRIANTEEWTDPVAVRAYYAAINLDVDSTIVERSVADVPLLMSSSPTVRAMMQFKGYGLAAHQKVLIRGLQEPQARFVGGLVAMTIIGMQATWFKAVLGNREEKLQEFARNPGWWIAEGLDRSGIFSVPMELSNIFEKATGVNPLKSPLRAFDDGSAISQKNQNRSLIGSIAGPTAGMVDDVATVAGIPKQIIDGEDIRRGQKNAGERLIPFNSYLGMRQMLRYVVNPPE